MGILNKLGGVLGDSKDLDIEEYMNSAEMDDVDVMNEPADFYVKPVTLLQESDIALIQSELQKRNIILLNVAEMAKRPNTLKTLVAGLKDFVDKLNGDIAKIDDNRLLLTPAKIKIIKNRKPMMKK